jgi:hypothetical protein
MKCSFNLSLIKIFALNVLSGLNLFLTPLWLGGLLCFGYSMIVEPVAGIPSFVSLSFGGIVILGSLLLFGLLAISYEFAIALAARLLESRLKLLFRLTLVLYVLGVSFGFDLLGYHLLVAEEFFPQFYFTVAESEHFLFNAVGFVDGNAQGVAFWWFFVRLCSLIAFFLSHHIFAALFIYICFPVGWFRLLQGGAEMVLYAGGGFVTPSGGAKSGSQVVAEVLREKQPRWEGKSSPYKILASAQKSPSNYKTGAARAALDLAKEHRARMDNVFIKVAPSEEMPKTLAHTYDMYRFPTGRVLRWTPAEMEVMRHFNWRVALLDALDLAEERKQEAFFHAKQGVQDTPENGRDGVVELRSAKCTKQLDGADAYIAVKEESGDFGIVKGINVVEPWEVKAVWVELSPEREKAVQTLFAKLYVGAFRDWEHAKGFLEAPASFDCNEYHLEFKIAQPLTKPRFGWVVFGRPEGANWTLEDLQQDLNKIVSPAKGRVILVDGTKNWQ